MRIGFISAALLVSQLSSAATPIDGWYSSLFGGYANVPNNIKKNYAGLNRTDASYQAGFDAGGSIGFKSNPMRYEGELTYFNAKINGFKINSVPQTTTSGYTNSVLTLANIYYDFQGITPLLQPFLGVGLGYAWVNARLNSEGPSAASHYSASNGIFAYQATAGLTYNFAENYALTFGYRYVGTEHADKFGMRVQANLVNLGVVYRFDSSNYK